MTALVSLALILLTFSSSFAAGAAGVPQWAFPGAGSTTAASSAAAPAVVSLAGSPVVFQQSDLESMDRAIDWYPTAHPPAPDVVMRALGKDVIPCGYCHLPNGLGRPENAKLQGLPADYIVAQVTAFASGARGSTAADYVPSRYMARVARAVAPADLAAAAEYFSQFEPQSHTRVVEAESIPAAAAWHFVYRFDLSRREPLGLRIVEGPEDPARSELRDPATPYIAYVPKGAIARGQAIAFKGASSGQACITCHGPALAGIAGASPTYLARQLIGFRNKSRNDLGAGPMQAIASRLTDSQIIDAAAYIGSRTPWTRADMPNESNQQ